MPKIYKNGLTPCVVCKKKYILSDPNSYEFNDDVSICKRCVLKVLNNTSWGIERKKRVIFEYKKVKISSTLRNKVFKRDNFTCKYCKTKNNLSIDHIFPESLGGTLDLGNLQTLCRDCNSKKRNKV